MIVISVLGIIRRIDNYNNNENY